MKRTVGGEYGYVAGNANESLNVRSAYGVSSGPSMVAVHDVRSTPSPDGKAETPGAGDVMSCMSSVWSLWILLVVVWKM